MNADGVDDCEADADPRTARAVDYFRRIAGLEVVRSAVAPHCGVLYIFFKATDAALKEAVAVAGKVHGHINVGVDDGDIVYQMSLGNSRDYVLGVLAGHFGPPGV